MAKHIGVKLPEDLTNLLKQGRAVAILATFSEKGLPHTTPIQCLYPKGSESILMSIHKDHTGYHNMVWQKKVMLCFLDDNNIVFHIIDIKSDRSLLTKVDSGVKWSYTSEDAEELSKLLMDELKDIARVL